MKRSTVVFAASVLLLIGTGGCKAAKNEASAPASHGHPAAAAPQAGDSLSGKVAETMNSGGYTYVLLEKNGQKTWVALPEAKVKVGQEVTCQPGMVMQNFTSKTLNRTFTNIVFSGGLL